MKTFIKLVCMSLTLVLLNFVLIPSAQAVPVFAKNYNMPCSACHSAFPRLNEFGAKFRLNGYRIPTQKGKAISENSSFLGLVGNLSLAGVRVRNTAAVVEEEHHDEGVEEEEHHDEGVEEEEHHDDAIAGETKSLNFSSSSLLVYSAGTLSKNMSYMAHGVVSRGNASLELFNVSYMDILPNGALNVRAGKMSVDLPYLSSSRRLTYTDYLLQIDGQGGHGHGEAEATGAGTTLTNTGIEANGVYNFSGGQYLEYVLGVGKDQVEGSGHNVNAVYSYLNYGIAGRNIGLVYRSNRTGESSKESLNTRGLGIAANVKFGRYDITSALFRYKQEAEHGDTVNVDSATFEVVASISNNWYVLGRYDRSNTNNSVAKSSQFVASAMYYFRNNIKLQLEFANKDAVNDLGDKKRTTGIYSQFVIGF